MERLLSEENKVHKHFNGFMYRFDKRIGVGRESWRCPRKYCKGRIYIYDDCTHEVKRVHEHVINPGIVEAKIAVAEE